MYVKFWTLYTMHGIVRHPRALYKKKKQQNINLELVSRRGRKKKALKEQQGSTTLFQIPSRLRTTRPEFHSSLSNEGVKGMLWNTF